MNAYQKAVQTALKKGYLVSGAGVTWIECEIRWRRRCQAKRKPVVIVSARKRLADLSLFLHRIPHADTTPEELYERLSAAKPLDFGVDSIKANRGMMGAQELFQSMAVENLTIKDALRLAPVLVEIGGELVLAALAPSN